MKFLIAERLASTKNTHQTPATTAVSVYCLAKATLLSWSPMRTPAAALTALSWLTAIGPFALGFVAAHASCQADVDTRRNRESEGLGDLLQIQLVHVINRTQAVAGICVDIRAVALLGCLLEVVLLGNQPLQLRLDVADLGRREFVLDDWDLGGFEMGEESHLVWHEKEQRLADLIHASCSSTHTVNVSNSGQLRSCIRCRDINLLLRRIWGIELDNPVNCWNLNSVCQHQSDLLSCSSR